LWLETKNKKRFLFNKDKSKIRASQGHSLPVELNSEIKSLPAILFHGIASKFLDSIKVKG